MTHVQAERAIDYGRGTRLEEAAREMSRSRGFAIFDDLEFRLIPELHVIDIPRIGRYRIHPGHHEGCYRYGFRYHDGGFSAEIIGVY